MTHPFFLGAQIVRCALRRLDLQRNTLDDFKPTLFERTNLGRIVRENSHLLKTEINEYLSALFVTPTVNIKAQLLVCLNGVRALILQGVGADLVDDAYAAPLLLLIDDRAVSFGCYKPHGFVKLSAAVASGRAKHISRHTL